MKILAIEASSLVASVAILTDDTITAEYSMNHKITHSQTLMPMIDEIIKRTDTVIEEFDAIAVSAGPGSFTGLRIGSATAKGLGQALNIPLIHVPTLDAMAYNAFGYDGIICPIMDARRSQVYTGIYSFEGQDLKIHLENSAISIDELMEKLNSMNQRVLFIGDGIPVFADFIKECAAFEYCFAPANMNRQRAASVASLGAVYYTEGRTELPQEHLPEYLRVSQAERERAERIARDGQNNADNH